MLKKINDRNLEILYIILLLTLIIFPFGQLFKFSISSGIKVSVLDLLLFLFIIFSFFKKFKINKDLRSPIKYEGLIFIMVSILSLIFASFKIPLVLVLRGFFYLMRFTIYFFFYLTLSWFLDCYFRKRKVINKGLFFAGVFVAIFGLFQYLLYPDLRNLLYLGWDPHYYRLFSTFFDPNFTGIILVLTIFQFLFMNFRKEGKDKILYSILLLVTITALVLTKSRSAFISFFIGLLLSLMIVRRFKKELLFGLIVAIIIVNLLPKPSVDVFNFFRLDSSRARVNNWKESFVVGLRNPFFGYGFGILSFPDSSFLYVWAGTGLIGLIFFSLIFFKMLRIGLLKKNHLFISTLVILVSSWFNNTIFYPWILYWLFLIWAQESQGS